MLSIICLLYSGKSYLGSCYHACLMCIFRYDESFRLTNDLDVDVFEVVVEEIGYRNEVPFGWLIAVFGLNLKVSAAYLRRRVGLCVFVLWCTLLLSGGG